MTEKWYVTHVFRGENYLGRGPYDENGEPADFLQMMWEGQAQYLRDLLNGLEKENKFLNRRVVKDDSLLKINDDLRKDVESLKRAMRIHAGDICSANNEADRFICLNQDLEEELAAAMAKYEKEAIDNIQLRKEIVIGRKLWIDTQRACWKHARRGDKLEEGNKRLREFLFSKIAIAKISADNENYSLKMTIKEAEQALKGDTDG